MSEKAGGIDILMDDIDLKKPRTLRCCVSLRMLMQAGNRLDEKSE